MSLLSDDVETEYASPGENLKLRLKGIEEEEILPGFILCNAENLCHSGRTFDAQVMIPALTIKIMIHLTFLEDLIAFFLCSCLQIVIIEHKSIICPGYNAVLHIHTCIEEVQITVSYFVCTCKIFRRKTSHLHDREQHGLVRLKYLTVMFLKNLYE